MRCLCPREEGENHFVTAFDQGHKLINLTSIEKEKDNKRRNSKGTW